ncbi:hypothetical protein J2X71_002246 [Rhizobium sp. 1399]|nr:hypothetical protein [Rhizobium sp. 1399]
MACGMMARRIVCSGPPPDARTPSTGLREVFSIASEKSLAKVPISETAMANTPG